MWVWVGVGEFIREALASPFIDTKGKRAWEQLCVIKVSYLEITH